MSDNNVSINNDDNNNNSSNTSNEYIINRQTYLSESYKVIRSHQSSYTDSNAKIILSPNQQHFACWNSGNISILCISSGEILYTLESDAEDEFLSFAINKTGEFIA